MTLLAEIDIGHSVLHAWVDTLVEEPFLIVSLEKFSDLPAVQAAVGEAAETGYAVGHLEALSDLARAMRTTCGCKLTGLTPRSITWAARWWPGAAWNTADRRRLPGELGAVPPIYPTPARPIEPKIAEV